MTPILSVTCNEPEGPVVRTIEPLVFSKENVHRFWERAKQFPSLYGRQILGDPQKFMDMFFGVTGNGDPYLNGLFWVVDPAEFLGVFYLNNIEYDRDVPVDAQVHYTFFDRRQRGRKELVLAMLRYVFNKYKFRRLSVQIPLYTKAHTRHFVLDLGFSYEGKKRKAAYYNDDWFDINLYGLLREDLDGNQN